MPDMKSDRVYALWFESSARFDYYLTGLSVALIAYWGKNLSPPTAVLCRETLLAVGLLVLLCSVLLGLLRMEKDIQATGLNFEALHLSERAQSLESAAAQNSLLHDVGHGVIQTPEHARLLAKRCQDAANETVEAASALGIAAQRLYRWRGRAFAMGLLFAIASRILPNDL